MAELASRKAPVAFEIDISSSSNSSVSSAHHHEAKRASHSSSSSGSDHDSVSMPPIINSNRSSSEQPAKRHWHQPPASSDSKPTERNHQQNNNGLKLQPVLDAEKEDEADVTLKADYFSSPSNNNSNKKKGWGPPVLPSDVKIAKGIVSRPSIREDNTPPRSYSYRSERDRLNQGAEGEDDSASVGPFKTKGGADEEGEGDYADDAVVMKRLEMKRLSQIDARNQAKGVLKKLREMKRKDSVAGSGAGRQTIRAGC